MQCSATHASRPHVEIVYFNSVSLPVHRAIIRSNSLPRGHLVRRIRASRDLLIPYSLSTMLAPLRILHPSPRPSRLDMSIGWDSDIQCVYTMSFVIPCLQYESRVYISVPSCRLYHDYNGMFGWYVKSKFAIVSSRSWLSLSVSESRCQDLKERERALRCGEENTGTVFESLLCMWGLEEEYWCCK